MIALKKIEVLQEHSYSRNPTEDGSEDNDFQAPKKRFRTPGVPQAMSCAKKQRLDNDIEIETTAPPKWAMELNVPNPPSFPSAENSPDFYKKNNNCEVEQEDICIPKIYFGTRTHKQIAQISRELRKTAYKHTKMCILSSREHSCIHPMVSKGKNKNEECKKLLDGSTGKTCTYNQRSFSMSKQKGIKSQGLDTAWDIEDLVALGKKLKACPYFASRELMEEADIVFCPYNYLIDPKIRSQMQIDLADQIVILDEGHNVEDSARNAASYTITAIQLQDAMHDLDKMVSLGAQPENNRALHVMLANILRWMDVNSSCLKETAFEQSSKIWSGTEILTLLEEIGLSASMLNLFKKNFQEVMAAQNDPTKPLGTPKLTSNTVSLLEGLVLVLSYVLCNNHKYVTDYRVALLKTAVLIRDIMPGGWQRARSSRKEWTQSLNFWCLNPAVIFSEIASQVRSLILTSGTLSPMNSFSSELGMAFPIKLEANHVVGRSQVWVGSLGAGPSGTTINACYKSSETFNFQDEVGNLLLEVCKVIPHGVLCFFPSYKMLEKLSQRWQATSVWSELEKRKVIVSEPRSGDREEFDEIMQQFYQAIKDSESGQDCDDEPFTGALFLAVCRGKVSEGLDFADNNARAVITVGIPFPNVRDIQVDLKRRYNNQYSSSRGLLTGNEWYEIQAFRALNQALGRCIRHKQDWGAIILVDERFNRSPRYLNGLSKWVRQRCQTYQSFNSAITSLDEFARAREIDPCPKQETSFLSSQGYGGPGNWIKILPNLSVCHSPAVQNSHMALTPKNQPKVTSFPDDFSSFCNGFVTSLEQQPKQCVTKPSVTKIPPNMEVHPLKVTQTNHQITRIQQTSQTKSISSNHKTLKPAVTTPQSKGVFCSGFPSSTPSCFRDESVQEHINFSLASTPVKNAETEEIVSESQHQQPKQMTKIKNNDSSTCKNFCHDKLIEATDLVCGFSIVARTGSTKDSQAEQAPLNAEKSLRTDTSVEDFPDSPDLFAASPLLVDENEKEQREKDELYPSSPSANSLPPDNVVKNEMNNCHSDDEKISKGIMESEPNDLTSSLHPTTRNLFKKERRKSVNGTLEKVSGDNEHSPIQHKLHSALKENIPPCTKRQKNSSNCELMNDLHSDGNHGHLKTNHSDVEQIPKPEFCGEAVSLHETLPESEITLGTQGKEKSDGTNPSSPVTGKIAKNHNPIPQIKAPKSNIRQARRKSSRLSTRKKSTSESECPKPSEKKTKKNKSGSEKQENEEVHGQLQCSSCGSTLVTGNYKKQKSNSRLLSEIHQLYSREQSVTNSQNHLDVMVHSDSVTSSIKPLTTEGDTSSTVHGLTLNSFFDPESKCCHVPQVCSGCRQKDGPAVVGVQVFPMCPSSDRSVSDDQEKSWVWLLHEAVLEPKRRKSRS